jgi:GcrA cell cycle regulator
MPDRVGAWGDPARIAELERLVGDGVPFAEIGARMGLTKNQVIAKARRMGFERRPDVTLTVYQQSAERAFATREANAAPPPPPRVPFPAPGHCVWPHGDPDQPAFHFCAAKVTLAGAPYCGTHLARAYQRMPGPAT